MLPRLLSVVIGAVLLAVPSSTSGIEYTINIPDEDVMKFGMGGADPYYKILTRNDSGLMYIGGREELVILDANTLTYPRTVRVPTDEQNTGPLGCADFNQPSEVDKICRNYIRVAERLNDTTLLICGTNSYNPICKFVNVNGGDYVLVDGRLDADKKIQLTLPHNSTALYNTINGQLFVGHSEELQPNPSHISKFGVTNDGLPLIAQTEDQNENYINEPDFVGKPFIYKGFIYFFYRETAVEVVNQGKFVYSRVGRVCENDTTENLFTFFKARLNCSLLGDFAFYFDYIQDVIVDMDSDNEPIFYAVFTTTPHGPPSAAVCSYRMADIINIFETSRFKGKAPSSGQLPGPVERPTYANKFTECATSFTNDEQYFQRINTLMDKMVPNYNPNDVHTDTSDPPLFYSTEMNLYSIAHDKDDNIFYVGTEHGTILRAVRQDGGWKVYEQELSDVKHPVTGLHYSSEAQSLLVVNERSLYTLNVGSCMAFCSSECEGFYSGYCQLEGNNCVSKRNSSISNPLKNVDVKILSLINTTITSCPSRRVELTCEVRGSEPCGEVNLVWRFKSDELVNCNGSSSCVGRESTVAPFIQYQEISSHPYYKLVHLSVDVFEDHTAGKFTCVGEGNGSTKEASVTVVASKDQGCLTKDTYDARKTRLDKLQREYSALDGCRGQMSTSEAIMFQKCDECPGDVLTNNNNNS